MTASSPRWAAADDDASLRRLCQRTPIVGPISYRLEREPEFFALTRLQGDAGGRVAIIEEGHDVVAMGMMAPHRAWIDGQPRLVAYLGDLKVDPGHRHEGLAGRIIRFLQEELDRIGVERSYFLVLAGNPAFARVGTSRDQFAARKIRSIRNHLVLFGAPRTARYGGVTIARASASDAAEMAALWNRVNARRNFAAVVDETRFAAAENFTIARRNGDIVGFCATWDASAMKQLRLLRLSAGLLAATKLYNVAAHVLRRPAFPSYGDCLRFLYVSQVCSENTSILTSLLDAIHDEHRRAGYLYFDVAFDRADDLAAALGRFRSIKTDFEIWEALTPARRESPPLDPATPAYFDMSLV